LDKPGASLHQVLKKKTTTERDIERTIGGEGERGGGRLTATVT